MATIVLEDDDARVLPVLALHHRNEDRDVVCAATGWTGGMSRPRERPYASCANLKEVRMRGANTNLSRSLILVALFAAIGGCYEEEPAPRAAAAPAPAASQPAPAAGGGQASGGNAYGGAKRAAQNTVDKVQERQQEVEKAAKDE